MSQPSGPAWCSRFPGSALTADLLPDFRDRTQAFISVMKNGHASVAVSATFRPPERAYLMHWCWMIAREAYDPREVPRMSGVDIQWNHSDAKNAAAQMASTYALKFRPSLTSRHTERRAIDMTIGWQGTLQVHDFDGRLHTIASPPRDGTNPELIAVGKTFGVIKLITDPPHWSDDGR